MSNSSGAKAMPSVRRFGHAGDRLREQPQARPVSALHSVPAHQRPRSCVQRGPIRHDRASRRGVAPCVCPSMLLFDMGLYARSAEGYLDRVGGDPYETAAEPGDAGPEAAYQSLRQAFHLAHEESPAGKWRGGAGRSEPDERPAGTAPVTSEWEPEWTDIQQRDDGHIETDKDDGPEARPRLRDWLVGEEALAIHPRQPYHLLWPLRNGRLNIERHPLQQVHEIRCFQNSGRRACMDATMNPTALFRHVAADHGCPGENLGPCPGCLGALPRCGEAPHGCRAAHPAWLQRP